MEARYPDTSAATGGNRMKRGVWLVLLAVALQAPLGCSLLTEGDEVPTSALLRIEGSSPNPLLVITSINFVEQLNLDTGALTVLLNQSDTVSVELPYEDRLSTAPDGSIYFELLNPEIEVASIRMRVDMDPGDQSFDQSATMSDGASLVYYFVYN